MITAQCILVFMFSKYYMWNQFKSFKKTLFLYTKCHKYGKKLSI